MIEQPSRRGLLLGLGAIIAAPAIVRASSLMPVKPVDLYRGTGFMQLTGMLGYDAIDANLGSVLTGIIYDADRTFLLDFTNGEMRIGREL